MKKLFFLFFIFAFCACSQASYKSPHEKRDLTVKNTTAYEVNIEIKARYNSVVYFNGKINAGQTLSLKGVPLCMATPDSDYDWRITKINDHSDTPVWHIRDLTDDEKIKFTILNYLTYKADTDANRKIKLTGKIRGTVDRHKFSKEIDSVLFATPANPPVQAEVLLYNKGYDLALEGVELYYKKKADGISYDETKLYPAFKRNDADVPPHWAADPNNPADVDKVPLFFTIDCDTTAKTISIKPL